MDALHYKITTKLQTVVKSNRKIARILSSASREKKIRRKRETGSTFVKNNGNQWRAIRACCWTQRNGEEVVVNVDGETSRQSVPRFILRGLPAISFQLEWPDPIRFHAAAPLLLSHPAVPLSHWRDTAACTDPDRRVAFPDPIEITRIFLRRVPAPFITF